MLLGQELKFKNKLCNLKLGTFFSALPGLGASALSGRVGLTGESSVREEMIGLVFAHIVYFLISLNYLLNIL